MIGDAPWWLPLLVMPLVTTLVSAVTTAVRTRRRSDNGPSVSMEATIEQARRVMADEQRRQADQAAMRAVQGRSAVPLTPMIEKSRESWQDTGYSRGGVVIASSGEGRAARAADDEAVERFADAVRSAAGSGWRVQVYADVVGGLLLAPDPHDGGVALRVPREACVRVRDVDEAARAMVERAVAERGCCDQGRLLIGAPCPWHPDGR